MQMYANVCTPSCPETIKPVLVVAGEENKHVQGRTQRHKHTNMRKYLHAAISSNQNVCICQR